MMVPWMSGEAVHSAHDVLPLHRCNSPMYWYNAVMYRYNA